MLSESQVTEGDTLANTFKTDYGNYSDGFRKFFHHEAISLFRRTNNEYVHIEKPCVSVVLSGTPKQISSLIPSAENGLFSRFMFYCMNINPEWINVFGNGHSTNFEEQFDGLGEEFKLFHKNLMECPEIEIYYSSKQKEEFNTFFSHMQDEFLSNFSIDHVGTVRRLGLIAFRISMILTALRSMETGDISNSLECSYTDFKASLSMIKILIQHTTQVLVSLPDAPSVRNSIKQEFLESLPKEFNRKQYMEVANNLGIKDKTAQKYISDSCKSGELHHDAHNQYKKSS